MPQTITETATLQCNQGTAESKLSVSSQKIFFIDDHAIASEADKQTGVNIKPFGLCKLNLFRVGICLAYLHQPTGLKQQKRMS